jgi:hypothetical protein
MTTRDELQTLHGELWALRDAVEDNFPTPTTLDALRFAVTECGEALDAYLRTKGGYSRNHEKLPDIYGELADCALMLMTALGREYRHGGFGVATPKDIGSAIDNLTFWASRALINHKANLHDEHGSAVIALAIIASAPGMDFAAELRKRMAKWQARWGQL